MAQKSNSCKHRGRVQIGVDKDGKPINKYVSASTLREIKEKKDELRKHYIEGAPVAEDMLFYEYAENWYKLKKEPDLSLSSKNAYETMFKKHILPAFGMRHLRAITANELQLFANSFAATSKSQITLMVSILKNIMKGAYADGIIDRDPSVSLKRPKVLPTALRSLKAPSNANGSA